MGEVEDGSMIREKIMCSTCPRSYKCRRLEQVERGLHKNDLVYFPSKDDDVVSSHLHLVRLSKERTHLVVHISEDCDTVCLSSDCIEIKATSSNQEAQP